MGIYFKSRVVVQSLVAVFSLLVFGFWLSGCTLGECGDQREICVGTVCVCGDKCSTDFNCNKTDENNNLQMCFAYEYSNTHGVCVTPAFMEQYGGPDENHPNGRHLPIPSEVDKGGTQQDAGDDDDSSDDDEIEA